MVNAMKDVGFAWVYSPHILGIILLFISCSPRYIIDEVRPTQPLSLPADDAAHYNAQTEWWYYTGHLTADDGAEYGFELTFFKRLTSKDRAPAWLLCVPAHWVKEVGMLAHFAVTDFGQRRFKATQMHNLCRKWRAERDTYHVAVNGWSARSEQGTHHLQASMRGYGIDLRLTPLKPAALHGPGGILDKGVSANYYYSYTRMRVEGAMTVAGRIKPVRGIAWMDHEFGPMELMKSNIAWDWFSIQLDNNTELMLYIIKKDGAIIDRSGGTFVHENGIAKRIELRDIEITPLATWKSPKTGAVYPSRWKIVIKPLAVTLSITPLFEDQELTLSPVTYWEGSVSVAGSMGRRVITGKGYVELVGYDTRKSFGTQQ